MLGSFVRSRRRNDAVVLVPWDAPALVAMEVQITRREGVRGMQYQLRTVALFASAQSQPKQSNAQHHCDQIVAWNPSLSYAAAPATFIFRALDGRSSIYAPVHLLGCSCFLNRLVSVRLASRLTLENNQHGEQRSHQIKPSLP